MSIGTHFVGGIGHLGENPILNVLADFNVGKESSLAGDWPSRASSRCRRSKRGGRGRERPGSTIGWNSKNKLITTCTLFDVELDGGILKKL